MSNHFSQNLHQSMSFPSTTTKLLQLWKLRRLPRADFTRVRDVVNRDSLFEGQGRLVSTYIFYGNHQFLFANNLRRGIRSCLPDNGVQRNSAICTSERRAIK